MGRIVIWCVTIVGIVPSVYLAIVGIWLKRHLVRIAAPRDYFNHESGADMVYVHDVYLQIGPGTWRVDLNPQYWSLALLLTGVVMIFVALSSILRPCAN